MLRDRPIYPRKAIATWCHANALGQPCCSKAVEQIYKPPRPSLGVFPTADDEARVDLWGLDRRPAIKVKETCSHRRRYKCFSTIEVDGATRKLLQQKSAPCDHGARTKVACTHMGLGHCCNAITGTAKMTPDQIIATTLECAQDAYPCEVIKAVARTGSQVDVSRARKKCTLPVGKKHTN